VSLISTVITLLHIVIIVEVSAVFRKVTLFSAVVAFDIGSIAGWAVFAEMALFSAVEALILISYVSSSVESLVRVVIEVSIITGTVSRDVAELIAFIAFFGSNHVSVRARAFAGKVSVIAAVVAFLLKSVVVVFVVRLRNIGDVVHLFIDNWSDGVSVHFF